MYDSLIFDLDGTLWDTSDTCALAWNNVIKNLQINFKPITSEDVRSVTGLPHIDCIRTIFSGLDNETIELISTETIKEDNKLIKDFGGELYPGVPETLYSLAENFKLFIVSNCQEGYIENFLEFTDFHKLFKDFECWGNTARSKSENIMSIIERNELKNTVYIGDTLQDKQSADKIQIPFIYTSYGFGNVESPAYRIDDFAELPAIVLNRVDQSLNTRSLSNQI